MKITHGGTGWEVTFTLVCSGNHSFPWFTGGIGAACGGSVVKVKIEDGAWQEATIDLPSRPLMHGKSGYLD
jgi:hypothetical protein